MKVHDLLNELASHTTEAPQAGALPTSKLTPYQRALKRHQARAVRYEQEMQRLHEAGADKGGAEMWTRVMRRVGR